MFRYMERIPSPFIYALDMTLYKSMNMKLLARKKKRKKKCVCLRWHTEIVAEIFDPTSGSCAVLLKKLYNNNEKSPLSVRLKCLNPLEWPG